jgi:hypothetical protein
MPSANTTDCRHCLRAISQHVPEDKGWLAVFIVVGNALQPYASERSSNATVVLGPSLPDGLPFRMAN